MGINGLNPIMILKFPLLAELHRAIDTGTLPPSGELAS